MNLTYETEHSVIFADAADGLKGLKSAGLFGRVALIVTSPPYPMIPMWDDCFSEQSDSFTRALENDDDIRMFTDSHRVLHRVWKQCVMALMPGGFLCINIGDAVRRVEKGGLYQLYNNAGAVYEQVMASGAGMLMLPSIIWRKPSNSPNKFLGSGMLPCGAYVTQEHEHILIFRKGDRRRFEGKEQTRRRASALFWEERNAFYTDLWQFPGRLQNAGGKGTRTGAFPLTVPERLILMFSLYGDLVMDPFMGTGTTMDAAIATGRSSVGFERDPDAVCDRNVDWIYNYANVRDAKHEDYLKAHPIVGQALRNPGLKTQVRSAQETDLVVMRTTKVSEELGFDEGRRYTAAHCPLLEPGIEREQKEVSVGSSTDV